MNKQVQFTRIATQFIVDDVVATAEHYRDRLGFELLGYFGEPPVFAMVTRGAAEMHFGRATGNPQSSNCLLRPGLGCDAYIWVDDVIALFDELSARGADVIDGPTKRVYNCTEIMVRDCNGFVIVFGG